MGRVWARSGRIWTLDAGRPRRRPGFSTKIECVLWHRRAGALPKEPAAHRSLGRPTLFLWLPLGPRTRARPDRGDLYAVPPIRWECAISIAPGLALACRPRCDRSLEECCLCLSPRVCLGASPLRLSGWPAPPAWTSIKQGSGRPTSGSIRPNACSHPNLGADRHNLSLIRPVWGCRPDPGWLPHFTLCGHTSWCKFEER